MKKVSIFLILLTITLITIDKKDFKDILKDFKDFFPMFVIFGVLYFFGYYIIGKIYQYNRLNRLENEIAEIFTDDFISRLKSDLAILKIKNEFRKISRSELCIDQPNEKID